jgi:dTMP kinase
MIPLGRAFTIKVLHGGDAGYGLILTALGTGAAIGVLTLLWLQKRLPRETVFAVACIACGIAIIAVASVSTLAPAVLIVAVVGATAGTGYVTGFTVLQENVADEMRGRIFATLYTVVRLCLLLALAVSPFTASLLGKLSNHLVSGSVHVSKLRIELPGVRLALWLGGTITLLSGIAAQRLMRRARRKPAMAEAST